MPPIVFARRPWCPLSAIEADAIAAHLPCTQPARRGRRPVDLRRTLDAVFWIAAGHAPWRELPPELGKPNSVARALRRWAKAGLLSLLLVRAARKDASRVLRGLAFWLCRAFRRMAKLVGTTALLLVRDVLRLADAWPASPLRLPDRNLSQTAKTELDRLGIGLKMYARRISRSARAGQPPHDEALQATIKAARGCIRAIRAGWRLLRLGKLGNRHEWKTR